VPKVNAEIVLSRSQALGDLFLPGSLRGLGGGLSMFVSDSFEVITDDKPVIGCF
jgi:hypothetical protein